MRKSDLVQFFNQIGLKPSRRLGQNFLLDTNTIKIISNFIDPKIGQHIIEIGSGIGNLTDLLILSRANLTLLEYDVRLANFLQKKYQKHENVRVIQKDASRVNYEHLALPPLYRCVGNLPYASSSVILTNILKSKNKPQDMWFLVQKEMAERISATPGSKSYNALSIRVQTLYEIKILKKVSPNVFWPIPEVDSAFIVLNLKSNVPSPKEFRNLSQLTKLSFSQRRKFLVSNLQRTYEKHSVLQALGNLGVDKHARAENLTPAQFLVLLRYLQEV